MPSSEAQGCPAIAASNVQYAAWVWYLGVCNLRQMPSILFTRPSRSSFGSVLAYLVRTCALQQSSQSAAVFSNPFFFTRQLNRHIAFLDSDQSCMACGEQRVQMVPLQREVLDRSLSRYRTVSEDILETSWILRCPIGLEMWHTLWMRVLMQSRCVFVFFDAR